MFNQSQINLGQVNTSQLIGNLNSQLNQSMGAQLASGHWPSQGNQSHLSSAVDSNRNMMQQRHTPSGATSAIVNT